MINTDYISLDKQCSIDALLERTISYMLFLQSVSEKAEKVSFFKFKFILSYRVTNEVHGGATTLKQIQNTLENKGSCCERKEQLESCPLRVEEFDQPGHLLIEVTVLFCMQELSLWNPKLFHPFA